MRLFTIKINIFMQTGSQIKFFPLYLFCNDLPEDGLSTGRDM